MSYQYYRKITIDHTKVADDLTDFPFLFNTTDVALKSVANGGKINNTYFPQWWDSDYQYRRRIAVTAAPSYGVSTGYSVKYNPTGSEASEIYNYSLANGNDFRVVYWNGSSWVELDRDLVFFTDSNIEVWFALQADIGGGAVDGDYFVYYGNSDAGSPPANVDNVYLFADNFDEATWDTSKWQENYPSGGYVITTSDSKKYAGARALRIQLTSGAASLLVKNGISATGRLAEVWIYDDLSENYHKYVRWVVNGTYEFAGGVNPTVSATHYATVISGSWQTSSVARTTGWHRFTIIGSTANSTLYIDGVLVRTFSGSSAVPGGFWIGNIWATDTSEIWFDRAIVRKHVTEEPTVASTPEVSKPIDLVFSPNKDGSDPYDFEVEKYDPETGELIAHVRIPSLSSSVNTVFYVCYGDPDVTISQENVAAVWDSGFKGVWHHGVDLQDSTVNNNDEQDHGTEDVAGKIGRARHFVAASSDYLFVPDADSLDFGTGNFSIELCLKTTQATRWDGMKLDAAEHGWGWYWLSASNFTFCTSIGAGTTQAVIWSTPDINDGNWHHLVMQRSGSALQIYRDGSLVASNTVTIQDVTSSDGINLGRHRGNLFYYNGDYDEFRASNVARSAGYITTTYNNQSDPATFYTLGGEPGPLAQPYSFIM